MWSFSHMSGLTISSGLYGAMFIALCSCGDPANDAGKAAPAKEQSRPSDVGPPAEQAIPANASIARIHEMIGPKNTPKTLPGEPEQPAQRPHVRPSPWQPDAEIDPVPPKVDDTSPGD
jgi:hypothetical protein